MGEIGQQAHLNGACRASKIGPRLDRALRSGTIGPLSWGCDLLQGAGSGLL